ncbi:MFS transporter, AAHS family, 4-hydroxybenzoate transporter [Variovorax sp. OK605]|uniref:MFS transporter n=1 Tax=Variovorax sp. OK605 TaxID=1855317 RepID=UPI0008E1EA50|nr:MFS transporter [Variovorax sp. OK605]SFQ43857.1 MFS transporter, AAHS family, 4-hydroxybenzoate transporter [Variovorax sp. OK605]
MLPQSLETGGGAGSSSASASASAAIDIPALIDSHPVSTFQKWILLLVGCAVVMDGFDVQAMGFVAPAIVHAWGIEKAALGPVFGAGLFGMLVGSLVLSICADRIGRRPVLLGATVFFALCMLATAFTHTLDQLLAMRFITGIGLGGIMANASALASEYSPQRRRVTLMMWVSCGFTGGAVLGGLISAVLIPWGGWQSVFIFGGVVPLVIAALMARYMPESMQFLVLRGRRLDRVHQWLGRIAPGVRVGPGTRYVVHEAKQDGAPVVELFRAGRGPATLLLWGINFMNLLNLFFLANWLPTIAADAGYSARTAVLVGTLLQVGGVVGTVAMGPLIDRIGFYRVLVPVFAVAVVAIAVIGQPALPLALLLAVVMVSGFCVVGAQPALIALASGVYPTTVRATGMGWSLGIGRAGSIVGPVLAGWLIGLHWTTSALFIAAAVPALLSCAMVLCMGRLKFTGAATVPAHVGEMK